MAEPDAVPLPREGEVFFDVRGEARCMRLSWYADSAVAVFSIWQGSRCTGTFRLPFADLGRLARALQSGPGGPAVTSQPDLGYLARDYDPPNYADSRWRAETAAYPAEPQYPEPGYPAEAGYPADLGYHADPGYHTDPGYYASPDYPPERHYAARYAGH